MLEAVALAVSELPQRVDKRENNTEELVKHARPDYDRIQDPLGLIPADEPVFLLRAQDRTAADTVSDWVLRNRELPDHDPFAINAAIQHIPLMQAWPCKKTADVSWETVTQNILLTEEWLAARGVLIEHNCESSGMAYSPGSGVENYFGVIRFGESWRAILSSARGNSRVYLGDVSTRDEVEKWIRVLVPKRRHATEYP